MQRQRRRRRSAALDAGCRPALLRPAACQHAVCWPSCAHEPQGHFDGRVVEEEGLTGGCWAGAGFSKGWHATTGAASPCCCTHPALQQPFQRHSLDSKPPCSTRMWSCARQTPGRRACPSRRPAAWSRVRGGARASVCASQPRLEVTAADLLSLNVHACRACAHGHLSNHPEQLRCA